MFTQLDYVLQLKRRSFFYIAKFVPALSAAISSVCFMNICQGEMLAQE